MKDVAGDARPVQQPHRGSGDQRGLLGRLGDNRVAGGEGRSDLAGEDRQREIPRRDAGKDAATMECHLVALAGGAGQPLGCCEIGPPAQGVIAQVVDRLAHLGKCRRDRATALADDEGHQLGHMSFEEIGGAFQSGGTIARRLAVPGGCGAKCAGERSIELGGAGRDDGPDLTAPVARIEDRLGRPRLLDAADDRCGRPWPAERLGERLAQFRQYRGMVKVEPARISPRRAVEVARQRDLGVRLHRQSGEADHRVGDDLVDRLRLVDDPVDEGGVGAVFEQPAHQIGKQVFMAADRSINPAWPIHPLGPDELFVERLAHPVQTLELVVPALAGELDDGGHRMGVMGGELWIEDRP